MTPDEINQIVTMDMQDEKPCILCHKLTRNRGMFFPNDRELYGLSSSKYPGIVYPFCDKHERNPANAGLGEFLICEQIRRDGWHTQYYIVKKYGK